MRTINDILKPSDGALGNWSMWANDTQTLLGRLTIRVPHKVPVNFTPSYRDITVQTLESDGGLRDCNHAGRHEDTITRYIGEDSEYEQYAVVCDKCDSWQDREGDWY